LSKPFQQKEVTKTEQIPLKATPAERALIDQHASDCGLSRSEYLLRCALGKPIRSKVSAVIINELRLLAQQQKDLFTAGGGRELSEEYKAILNAIVAAMERIAAIGVKGLDDDS
jgi:uncharacterized protein (DUF1778 family)